MRGLFSAPYPGPGFGYGISIISLAVLIGYEIMIPDYAVACASPARDISARFSVFREIMYLLTITTDL